jgi:hypothetical protein
MIENSNPQNKVSYCKMGKYTYSVMQFHAPQNATGCNKIFPNKHSLNSARLGKNRVKWGVFIPSVVRLNGKLLPFSLKICDIGF